MQAPLESHWQAVKRIVKYLSGTLDFGLTLQPSSHQTMTLEGYYDADWHQIQMTDINIWFLCVLRIKLDLPGNRQSSMLSSDLVQKLSIGVSPI